ncbi:MAG: LON peptidase substrate-binding domain-containing protein [Spirochaetes bacterium]|nr:LON peptidase substrate-binding domain-containing protein [Spirochaetota bacterium]
MRIFYSYRKVLFPHCGVTVPIKRKLIAQRYAQGDTVIVYPVKSVHDYFSIKNVGVLAEVMKVELSDTTYLLSLKGLKRVKILSRKGLFQCQYEEIDETLPAKTELAEKIRKKAQELIFLINVDESDKLIHLLNYISDGAQLTDFIANYFILDYDERITLLNTIDVKQRIAKIITLLDELIAGVKRKRESEIHEKENIPG